MDKKGFRFNIGLKILLGFIPLLMLVFISTSVTLIRLNRTNRINREVISIDMVAENTAQNMGEILLAEESYARRYLILYSEDIFTLFKRRSREFELVCDRAKSVAVSYPSFDSVVSYHQQYNHLLDRAFASLATTNGVSPTTDSLQRVAFDRQMSMVRTISSEARLNQSEKMVAIAQIGSETFRTVAMLTGFGIALIILVTLLISRNILRSIGVLKAAAHMVSFGTFIHLPKVKSNDELGDLSTSFNEMAERLIKLEEAYKDASPLTRLPGGIAIENTVKQRIDNKIPFAFCMMDLDNFKPFNDRYGYARGNSVIKMTAEILVQVAKESGDATDFVGHIGGDDFVLVSTPERFEQQCRRVIEEFDRRIIDQYDDEDRKQKCIRSVSRQGEHLNFPIMTISIAAINSLKSTVHNYIEVGEIVAELKKYAKKFAKSNIAVDRRGGKKGEIHASIKE